jgi:hypothetical protein
MRKWHELCSIAVGNGERKFFKVRSNSSTDPHIDAIARKLINIGDNATETELLNVTRFTEREHSVDEERKSFKHFPQFSVTVTDVVVVEVEDFEMLPEVAPPARHETHSGDGGSCWKEG